MDLKEQARALELLRKLVEFAKQIDEATIRELETGELTTSERKELFSALGWLSFWADFGQIFLSLETPPAEPSSAPPVTLTVEDVGFHCGVGAKRSDLGWVCVVCGEIFHLVIQ